MKNNVTYLNKGQLKPNVSPIEYHFDYRDKIKENNHDGGALSMSNFVSKEEFGQFEKRIENQLNSLERKLDSLPTTSDLKVMLLENNEKLQKERKHDRNTIIGWIIGFVGLGFTVAKAFGWI